MGHKETGRLRSTPPTPEINKTTCRNLVNDKGDISNHSDKDGFYHTGCWYTEQTFGKKLDPFLISHMKINSKQTREQSMKN